MSSLDAFRQVAASDPLFAAEGMDIDRARRNLAEVSDALRELERALSRGSLLRRLFLARYPLRRYAVPTAFVRSFIDSEEARRRFLSDPSELTARALCAAWKHTARAYARDLARYRALHDVLSEIEPDVDAFEFQDMFGNVSSMAYVDQTLDRMEENAHALVADAAARERILRGGESYEEHGRASRAALVSEPAELNEQQRALHALQLAERMPFDRAEVLRSHGPYRFVLPHFDGALTPHVFMAYELRERIRGVELLHIALVDDFFFLKISGPDADFGGLGRANFEELIERGIPYWHQNATALYTMRDQTYWADVATIADLAHRPELDHRAVEVQRSSMFDLMLGMCAMDIRGYAGHTYDRAHKKAFATYSFLFGLLMRSHPSIYYLPFNASVWRLPEPLSILGERRVAPEKIRYRPLRDVLPDMGPEMLTTVMQGTRIRREARQKKGITHV